MSLGIHVLVLDRHNVLRGLYVIHARNVFHIFLKNCLQMQPTEFAKQKKFSPPSMIIKLFLPNLE